MVELGKGKVGIHDSTPKNLDRHLEQAFHDNFSRTKMGGKLHDEKNFFYDGCGCLSSRRQFLLVLPGLIL